MRPAILAVLLLALASLSIAEDSKAPPRPSSIVFITSTSNLAMDYQLLQVFESRWREREPLAVILPCPLAPYAFPLTPKANELIVAGLAERLNGKAPTLIVAQGDPAFFLALALRDTRFTGSPIIAFDVVGNEGRRKKFEKDKSVYAVGLSNIGEQNVELAMRLFPKRKRAVLLLHVGNELQTASVINDRFAALFPSLTFVTIINPSQDSADAALRVSPENTFVVGFSPGWVDSAGRFRSGKDYVRSIMDTYNVPMFEYLRSDLDGGTVGGVGMLPSRWGVDAADRGLALIFDKKEPEHWITGSSFTNAFADFREIQRFGSSPRLLPPGTELINVPASAWVRYQYVLEPLLALLALGLAFFIMRSIFRRRVEKVLVEANERLELEVAARTSELRCSNEELEVSNMNLIEAMRRTEDMQEKVLRSAREITLGRFAAGMANGINSPLCAVRAANSALRAVVDEGELAERLLAFDEEQRSLFRRFVPRILSKPDFVGEALKAEPDEIERRLSRLSGKYAFEVASDLSDAGLAGLNNGELAAFADEKGRAVAQALYYLSTIDCSTWIIDEAVDRAAETIKAVREYAADSNVEAEDGIVDLRGTIERALLIFKNRLPRSVTLETYYVDVPPVRGSETIFVRVWASLVQNAFQAMPLGGRLDISLRRDDGFAVVSVGDEGEGVDPSVAGKIFEPFVTTRPTAEGMGLGLAYCKRTIESMGGSIGFVGKAKGTVFQVRVPLREAP
jgi:signal transduction histidine kinase